jgi:hypothetical protein
MLKRYIFSELSDWSAKDDAFPASIRQGIALLNAEEFDFDDIRDLKVEDPQTLDQDRDCSSYYEGILGAQEGG